MEFGYFDNADISINKDICILFTISIVLPVQLKIREIIKTK